MPQTHAYPELMTAREDMRAQSELYRPSPFWDEGSSRIVDELCERGIENFRSLVYPLRFFVPTYGTPGHFISQEASELLMKTLQEAMPGSKKAWLALEQFLSGRAAAKADYCVFLAADDPQKPPFLHHFSESKACAPAEHHEFDGKWYSRSALNYLLGLCMLKKHLGPADEIRTVLEIGGGFGTLGEILGRAGIDGLHYVNLDIPPISYVAQHYLTEVMGTGLVTTYAQTREANEIQISQLSPLAVLCAWQIEKLQGQADLFVNFISFQEMEPHIVTNYLKHITRLKTRWILLRNMREGKQLRKPGQLAGVETPILGDDYLAMLPDYELVDRNVHPFGYQTVDGYHSELLLLRRKK